MPSEDRYGATVVSRRATPWSFAAQFTAAVISVRENSNVTKGPAVLPTAARPATARDEPPPSAVVATTAATAAMASRTRIIMCSLCAADHGAPWLAAPTTGRPHDRAAEIPASRGQLRSQT